MIVLKIMIVVLYIIIVLQHIANTKLRNIIVKIEKPLVTEDEKEALDNLKDREIVEKEIFDYKYWEQN